MSLFASAVDAALFSQRAQQVLLLPFNALYFTSHVVPLVGLVPEDNIREGTSYKYFASELLVFACLISAVPRQMLDTWPGRVVLAIHLPLHVGLVVGDYLAHDTIVKKALYKRSEDPLQWLSSKLGLAVDSCCHAVAAVLLSIGILEWAHWWLIALVYPLGVIFYLVSNRKYFLPRVTVDAAGRASSDFESPLATA